MKNWFNPGDAADLIRRLDDLTPDGRPKWGSFTPQALLCHLADPVRVAMGEKAAKPLRGALALPGIAHAIVWFLPWPRAAPTAPEFLPGAGMTTPKEFKEDKRVLVDVLCRFSETPKGKALSPNPVFGRLSRRAWGRLMWRHLDHHLRQFGL